MHAIAKLAFPDNIRDLNRHVMTLATEFDRCPRMQSTAKDSIHE
jgi:hypothetical protein